MMTKKAVNVWLFLLLQWPLCIAKEGEGQPGRLLSSFRPINTIDTVASLDLDLQVVYNQLTEDVLLSDADFQDAFRVYTQGGHAEPFALLQIDPVITQAFDSGSVVEGTTNTTGQLLEPLSLKESVEAGAPVIGVWYPQNTTCRVGALASLHQDDTSDCFQESGSITIGPSAEAYSYAYRPLIDNHNALTLQYLSLRLETCQYCPIVPLAEYMIYYGEKASYADEYIQAAMNGTSALTLLNGEQMVNFREMSFRERATAATTAMVVLNVWMGIHHRMHEAQAYCEADLVTHAYHAWDSAMSLYVGSTNELFLHMFADEACQEMHTCGFFKNQANGTSFVNTEIIRKFDFGRDLLGPRYCGNLKVTQADIRRLMWIPLIQRMLSWTYQKTLLGGAARDVISAKAFTVAVAVSPFVYKCDSTSATEVLRIAQKNTPILSDYESLKSVLEANYMCFNVACDEIGGVYDVSGNTYYPGASPCNDDHQPTAATAATAATSAPQSLPPTPAPQTTATKDATKAPVAGRTPFPTLFPKNTPVPTPLFTAVEKDDDLFMVGGGNKPTGDPAVEQSRGLSRGGTAGVVISSIVLVLVAVGLLYRRESRRVSKRPHHPPQLAFQNLKFRDHHTDTPEIS